jgi:dTDP-4-amino-4,6-dideoxygalactose transaminase
MNSHFKVQLCELNYDKAEEEAVANVLKTQWLTMGDKTNEFERNFVEFQSDVKNGEAIAVSSATAALHLILMALNIKKGDEVILPGLTFVSDANVVQQLGATPIFSDSNSIHDFNTSITDVISRITDKTKVIIVVHFAGFPIELQILKSLCDNKGITLIEDCAHAPGASVNNIKVGNLGHASFFSFFSNKNLAVGEGGMVYTGDKKLAARVRSMRSHGMTSLTLDRHKGRAHSYDVIDIGLNYRIDEMRSALGIVQLSKLIAGNEKRKQLFSRYKENLASSRVLCAFTQLEDNLKSAYHIMPVIIPQSMNRIELMNELKSRGIQTSIHYPPFSGFSAYESNIRFGELPIVDEICARELTLPLHPKMKISDVDYVCENLKEIIDAM